MAKTRRRRLQATYIPAEHGIAWWGVADIPAALEEAQLPAGRELTLRLAVADDGAVRAADVETRVTDLQLTAQHFTKHRRTASLGDSARAWRLIGRAELSSPAGSEPPDLAVLTAHLPPAGHALLNADETAIVRPEVLVAQFRAGLATVKELQQVGIKAEFRPYQLHGVSWLRDIGGGDGGAVLADEMGLGKTLQAIALLATSTGEKPHLVVCPTSLVGNWRREVERFAPQLPVLIHHGAARRLPEAIAPGTVVLTTYPLLRADAELTAREWQVAVLDEAQQIKNPAAKVTQAATQLKTETCIAMTGTPVENNLDELWSIFSVASPGLLGTRGRFRQRFITPIQQRGSKTAAARLNELVQPRMLRRTKQQVATELPPRLDSTVVCSLSDEQIRLYRTAVEDAFSKGFGSAGARSGRVLALLTELKQICNHPAHFLGEGEAVTGRSGKFDRTSEMVAEIVADDEGALIFTQYRKMGELLSSGLAPVVGGRPVPFLHGGLGVKARDEMLGAFQEGKASPVLILSLRAAGFGLNLTRASHVIHYDRWWNPAVEEQATARAHRIGQERVLNVHTLVVGGTLEDHIERMHRQKKGLAEVITGDSVSALTRLPDKQLRELIDLNPKELV